MTASAGAIVVASGLTDTGVADIADSVTVSRMPKILERLLGRGVHAITLGTSIYVRPDRYESLVQGNEAELLAHELVHARQWRDHGKVGFLAKYLSDYTRLRLLGLTHAQAYHGIGFEHAAFKESKRMVDIV